MTTIQKKAKIAAKERRDFLESIESSPEEMPSDDVFESGFFQGCMWLLDSIKGQNSEH